MSVAVTSPLPLTERVDPSTLALVAAGDSRAVVSFYQEHARDLYRFIALRVGGPVEDIEELLQDTMIAAIQSAARFRGECSPRTWLCGIARNQILQRRRTETRKKRVPASHSIHLDEEIVERLYAASESGQALSQDLVENMTVKAAVNQILDELGEDQRELLLLRYVDEFSVQEIGRIQNRGQRAVEGLLRRARQHAREIGEKYL